METGRLKIKVFKGLAATSELLQVQVDKESIVFELMLTLQEQRKLHWRRQRILCEGQPVDECDRWSQITTEDSIDVQMLNCDHRHLTPIDDRLKLLAMVRCKGEALSFASQELKDDEEIVRIAMATSASSLQFASKSLKRDPELVELGISKDPKVFRIVGNEFRGDPVLAKQAIDADPHHILYCRPYLYRNKKFMTYCVQKRASLLRYATVDLGREIYLSALQQDGLLLRFLMKDGMLLWPLHNSQGCNEEEFARTAALPTAAAANCVAQVGGPVVVHLEASCVLMRPWLRLDQGVPQRSPSPGHTCLLISNKSRKLFLKEFSGTGATGDWMRQSKALGTRMNMFEA
eukprot:Skav205999  [mRNA]  locus=scaffold2084:374469:376463:- [translate_table: standard]